MKKKDLSRDFTYKYTFVDQNSVQVNFAVSMKNLLRIKKTKSNGRYYFDETKSHTLCCVDAISFDLEQCLLSNVPFIPRKNPFHVEANNTQDCNLNPTQTSHVSEYFADAFSNFLSYLTIYEYYRKKYLIVMIFDLMFCTGGSVNMIALN